MFLLEYGIKWFLDSVAKTSTSLKLNSFNSKNSFAWMMYMVAFHFQLYETTEAKQHVAL